MKRWSRGALIAVIVGIATAIGLLNLPRPAEAAQAAGPTVELTYSLHSAVLEVRVGAVTVELDF